MLHKLTFSSKSKDIAADKRKQLQDYIDSELSDSELQDANYTYKVYGKALTGVPPGEILKLNYSYVSEKTGVFKSGDKVVLVTATERGPNGNFISTRDNKLLCCFELNPNSFTFKLVLKLFHQKDNRCNYQLIPGFLKFIFGLDAFKTLDITKASMVYKLLKKKKVA
jgi:hypothetical protein